MKYLRIPFEEDDYERIDDKLSLGEQKDAIIRAFNEKVETTDEDEDVDELSKYERTKDIREDDSISPEERKRRLIRARRQGIPR